MSIEFHCPHCDKYLKTNEDKAGRMADCPGCSQKIEVPDISDFRYQETDAELTRPIEYGDADVISEDTKPCPMCGQEIKVAAIKCRFCGEEFGAQPAGEGEIRPTVIDVGDVMGTSWEVYKANFGICFGVGFLVAVMSGFASGPSSVINIFVDSGELAPEFGILSLLLSLVANVFGLWLGIGHIIFLLKLVRGQNAEVTDIFSGTPFFLSTLGAAIVFGVVYLLGAIACLIPGLYVLAMWWPFIYLIVDQNAGAMDSLSKAREITTGNKLSAVVLFLAAMGLTVAGLLAMCIGVLFVAPYLSLMWCVAYLRMTGQPIRS